MDDAETLNLTDDDEWRRWLSENFQRRTEIWLIYPKKQTGKPHGFVALPRGGLKWMGTASISGLLHPIFGTFSQETGVDGNYATVLGDRFTCYADNAATGELDELPLAGDVALVS